jgi:hypothetical protein
MTKNNDLNELEFFRYSVPNSLFSKDLTDKFIVNARIINAKWDSDILVLENQNNEICYISKLEFKKLHKDKKIIIQ